MNNEFDDIFRHAAENYPLNTGQPAWDALRKKMDEALPEPEAVKNEKSYFKTFLFSLLALFICLPFILQDLRIINKGYQLAASGQVIENKNENSSGSPAPLSSPEAELNLTQDPPLVHSTVISSRPIANKNSRINIADSYNEYKTGNISTQKNKPLEDKQSMVKKEEENLTNNHPNNNLVAIEGGKAVTEKTVETSTDSLKETGKLLAPPPAKKDKNINNKSRRFYAVVLGGPDISMIKMQEVKKIGFNGGIHLGYQVSGKLSVEAGLLLDKKYYNSEGKYLKYNKIYAPTGAVINYLEGYCRMIEIPVQVNYVFKNTKRGEWYATGGASSYLMQEDKYTLNVTRNNYTYNRDFAYKKPGNVILAVANLGIGYNRSLGKTMSIRVQPYVKLPLKEMGTGSLPIQSTGINLGVIKKLF